MSPLSTLLLAGRSGENPKPPASRRTTACSPMSGMPWGVPRPHNSLSFPRPAIKRTVMAMGDGCGRCINGVISARTALRLENFATAAHDMVAESWPREAGMRCARAL